MSTGALRAALKRMANAADAVGVAHFDSDDLSPEVEELQRSTEEARAALAQPVSAECMPLTDEAAPVATDARSMLEFLSARFKHAGVSEAVAESYARDIDAILAALRAEQPVAIAAPQQTKSVPVATVTECEACFTPDVCQLRGTCDHYAAEQLRVAPAPPPRVPLSDKEVFMAVYGVDNFDSSLLRVARAIERAARYVGD